MKTQALETHFHSGNEQRQINYKIAEGEGGRMLMRVLQEDLYKQPMKAFIREVSCNAWDSHIRAGVTHLPIEVTLPTLGDPNWVCQDWGEGMNEQDFEDFYATLGGSTSREFDDTIGMLGLGAKSPLAYALSFSVRSTKDGVTLIADVSKDEDDIGVINILSSQHTGEPNGVRVSVPIPNTNYQIEDVRTATMEFFSYWREQNVLIGGETVPTIDEDTNYLKIEDDLYLIREGYKSHIVMGDVCYIIDTSSGKKNVCAYVPMGSVRPTPNREDLHMNDLTKSTLETVYEYVDELWPLWLKDRCRGLNDWEQLKFWASIPRDHMRDVKWKSLGMNVDMNLGRNAWSIRSTYSDNIKAGKIFKASWLHDKVKFVANFSYKRVSVIHKESLKAYGEYGSHYVFIPDSWKIDWSSFPKDRYVLWEDVPQLKRERTTSQDTPVRQAKTKYNIYYGGDHLIRKEMVVSETVLYLVGGKDEISVVNLWAGRYTAVKIVLLQQKQLEKFLRLHPDAIELHDWVETKRDNSKKQLTAVELKWIVASDQHRSMSDFFRSVWKDIPESLRIKLLPRPVMDKVQEYEWHFGTANYQWKQSWTDLCNTLTENHKSILKEYPLIQQSRYSYNLDENKLEDYVLYINAKNNIMQRIT